MSNSQHVEPWLRGTLLEVPAVQRATLHALELAREDLQRWCGGLDDNELNTHPAGLAPVAFHLRHIPRSVDCLLTYAEGRELSPQQLAALKTEAEPATHDELFQELSLQLTRAMERVRSFQPGQLEQARVVGRRRLPTTVAGLIVHVAEHTQRHVGQAIITAKLVRSKT